MEITKEMFQAYEDVRVGGVTNMWDTNMVSSLSGGVISSDEALEVIKTYEDLCKQYTEVRKLDE